MLLLRAERLPEGPDWLYELKLDGYRPLAIKSYGVAHLRSRNNKSFDAKYPAIVLALARLVAAVDSTSYPDSARNRRILCESCGHSVGRAPEGWGHGNAKLALEVTLRGTWSREENPPEDPGPSESACERTGVHRSCRGQGP